MVPSGFGLLILRSNSGTRFALFDMKIFTIAVKSHETYGHGDNGIETRIIKLGSYGTGDFPPCFPTYKLAAEWLSRHYKQFYVDTVIVELELREH